jgi:hypothetical protein
VRLTNPGKRRDTYRVTCDANGVGTVTFGVAFPVTPHVATAVMSTVTTHPTMVEVTALSTTSVSVKCWRAKDTGVLVGGTIVPTEVAPNAVAFVTVSEP